MAKRSRRARKRAKSRAASSTSQTSDLVAAPSQAPATALPAKDPAQGLTYSQEYRYVVDDLKRVTILAAAMFALLIALSFFIG